MIPVIRFLLFLVFFVNSLKISFKTSESLTKLSLYNENLSLNQLISTLFSDDEFWPILVEFNQARYFNFESFLIEFISYHVSCTELLNILSLPDFPTEQLITGRVLIECSDCLAKMTLETLQRTQNPSDFFNFDSSQWLYKQNLFFIASDNVSIRHKWSNVCMNWDLFEKFIDEEDDEVADSILDSISMGCFTKLTTSSTLKLLEKLYEDIKIQSFIIEISKLRDEPTLFSLFSMFPSIDKANDLEEKYFLQSSSVKFLKRTITIISLIINNFYVVEIYSKGVTILSDLLHRLKDDNRRNGNLFSTELIILIEGFLNVSTVDTKIISELLLNFIGYSHNGTWLLNVYCVFKHFGGINYFLRPFLEIFFNPGRTNLSTSDIDHLLKLIPGEHRQIYGYMTRLRRDLVEPFYEDYGQSIYPSMKEDNIPEEIILSFAYKSTRKYDTSRSRMIAFQFDVDWITIIKCLNKIFDANDRSKLLPLNLKVVHRQKTHNLAYLLDLFFKNMIKGPSTWWIVTGRQRSRSQRPKIVPSLNLPPQVMETFGYILATAMNANIRIPFIIDWEYFIFVFDDTRNSIKNSKILKKFYPKYKEEFTINLQVTRILKLEKQDSLKEISFLLAPESFWLSGSSVELINNESDLLKLMAHGSSILRSSFTEALNFEQSINLKTAYKLLFK